MSACVRAHMGEWVGAHMGEWAGEGGRVLECVRMGEWVSGRWGERTHTVLLN